MAPSDTVPRSVAVDRLLARRDDLWDGTTETVALDAVAGRTVAVPVTVPEDVPARGFATMDGFAVATADDYPLAVTGSVGPADDPPTTDEGEAVEIATGAPLPDRTDAVVRREDATVTDGALSGPALDPGTNRYPAGATAAAGERVFDAGDRLAPRHAAFLRDVGVDSVEVRSRLSVGVLATGTEIHEGRQPDRDSEMLANLVRAWGHRPTLEGTVPDDETAVREAIERAAATHDLVLTSGGTSVGRADHVGSVLAANDPLFTGVALRPGRPVTAATVDGTLVCGLPGKPVAAHTAATLVLRPLLTGERALPTVAADPTARVDLPDGDVEYAVPVVLDEGRAVPFGHENSPFSLYGTRFAPGRVSSSTRVTLADGVVLADRPLVPGESVAVVPFEVVE